MRSLLPRVRPVLLLYVLASAGQVTVLRVTGVVADFHLVNLIPVAVLIVMLLRGSRVAWWLLVAINAAGLLLSTTLIGPGTLWLHVALFAGCSVVLLSLLWCRAMREHVGAGVRSARRAPAGGVR